MALGLINAPQTLQAFDPARQALLSNPYHRERFHHGQSAELQLQRALADPRRILDPTKRKKMLADVAAERQRQRAAMASFWRKEMTGQWGRSNPITRQIQERGGRRLQRSIKERQTAAIAAAQARSPLGLQRRYQTSALSRFAAGARFRR